MIYVNNWQSLRKKSTSLLLCIALSFQFVGTSFVSAASSILGTTGDLPSDITIDSAGNIYTTNYGSNNVTKITPAGVSTILGTTGDFPSAINIDSAGNIYTANIDSNNVTKITPAGVSTILGTTGTNPWGITVDTAGNIYTANNGSNNVTKITPAGVSTILGTTGDFPSAINIDTAGNIYTANYGSNNVTKITPAGVSTILGTTGTSPYGITIDSAGNIYTANSSSNNVTKITPAGVSTILGTTGTSPVGITVDTAGNIYTANYGSNNVTKITPAGVSTILGTTGTGPYGITIDSAGNIYTANLDSNNVTKIENSAPTDITLSGTTVADGAIAPIIVGTLSTTDPDVGDTHTYFLNRCTIPGTDDASFSLSGNVLSLATTPDYATQSSYNICIRTVDAGGLTYDKNFVINVVDTTPPTVPTCTASPSTTSGATTVTCTGTESGATLTIPGLSCSPTPADATGAVSCTGSILTSNPTLTIADPSGNTATGTVTVTLDITAPAIPILLTPGSGSTLTDNTPTFSGTGEVGATIILTISGQTLTGTVNASGNWNITPTTPLSDGLHTVTVTLTDTSGNMSPILSRPFTVDTTPPVLTLIGSGTISLPFGGTYTEYGARWTDAIDGSGTLLTATSGSVNPNIAGTYTLTYRYTDTAGNTTTITRTVTIGQPVGPGGGGGGGGSYSPSVPVTPSQPSSTDTVVPPTTIPPEYQIQLLPTQSQVIPSGLNTDGQLIYTLKSPLTDYICPQIVQVYSENELKAQDIPSNTFTDDMKSVIMYRGLEKDEQMSGQTFLEYKRFGIAINDRAFEPNRNVTRAEYVKMLVRALSCRYQKEGTNTPFSDVANTKWYAEYINFATNHGWISGYGDTTFRPDAPITRAEAAKILANAIQLKVNTGTNTQNIQSSFSDVPNNSVFTPYIEALKNSKVISGRTKTTYAPNDYIPRTEASRLVYRTFLGGNN